MIGEIRDEETATICVRAALTGHLVISTLHAGSCKGVLERLFILCPDHSAVASSLNLVINQRLVRQFCAECKGKGCTTCLQSGYRGRVPLVEWLKIDGPLRPRLASRDFDAIQVNPTLAQRARVLVDSGITTNEAEINRVLGFQWQ